uniref:Uncharacterized protein n=1 Tax=Lygus hesperus TaxID=30085 RepID=A0A146LBC0_LYGHE
MLEDGIFLSHIIKLILETLRTKFLCQTLASCSTSDPEEIKELKKRLSVVKEETLQETRRLTDVRKKEVRIQGEQAQSCVNAASSELEQNVEAELERRLGPLERELDEGKSEDREELRKKVEVVTVGAGAAVEERTLAFVQKANNCNQRVTGASFKGPTPTK